MSRATFISQMILLLCCYTFNKIKILNSCHCCIVILPISETFFICLFTGYFVTGRWYNALTGFEPTKIEFFEHFFMLYVSNSSQGFAS